MSESIWPVIQEAAQAFGPHYQEQTGTLLQDMGFEQGDWFISFVAYGLEPEPLTAVSLHQPVFPYSSLARVEGLLAAAAGRGFLAETDKGHFVQTEKGRNGMERFFETAWDNIGELTPLPNVELNILADLLYRMVMALVTASEPADKTNLQLSRRTDPGLDAPAMVRIDQYLTDLLRYRDDAHRVTWKNLDISGNAWEAFSYLWRGDAKTLAELAEKLPARGFESADYAQALQALKQRGWLVEDEDGYRLTAVGQDIRNTAEAQTDKNFSVGLWALDKSEIAQLTSLLTQLKEGLAVEAEPVPA